jgi:hypothetical protein
VESLNRGVALCRAPLIARLDADDICLPGRFSAQVSRMRAASDLAVLGSQIRIMSEAGQLIRISEYPVERRDVETFMEHGSPLAHPSVILRKDVVESVGLYRKAYAHAEDYDLWLRVRDAGFAIENLDQPLLGYRQHAGNVSIVFRRQQAIATLVALLAHRARTRGLPDPTEALDTIDDTTIDLFSPALQEGLEEELFAVRLGTVSLASREGLARALVLFAGLPGPLRQSTPGIRFQLSAARAALAFSSYADAVSCLVKAFSSSPFKAGAFVGDNIMNRLAGMSFRKHAA